MMGTSFDLMLVAGRAVFLVFSFALAAVSFTLWRRATRTHSEQLVAHNTIVLQRLADIETRVDATKALIVQLAERMDQPQRLATGSNAPSPGYQIAIRLAKGGASLDELMSGCGLSLHEAELVQRLHAPHSGSHGLNS
jgi:alkylation response protein AidB-like acyl-CoA dehydrogenase